MNIARHTKAIGNRDSYGLLTARSGVSKSSTTEQIPTH